MFRRGKIFFTFLPLFFLSLISNGQRTQYIIKNIKVLENYPSPVTFSIYQDSRGFMWFGTINGLYRYDGYNYKAFHHNPQDSVTISDNLLRSTIFEDNSRNLWIGGSKALNKFIRKTERFQRFYSIQLKDSLIPLQNVSTICQDRQGYIWIVNSLNQVVKFSPDISKAYAVEFSKKTLLAENFNINILYCDHEGSIWAGTSVGLFLFNPTKMLFEKYPSHKDQTGTIGNYEITQILEDGNSILWLATENGIIKADRSLDSLRIYSFNDNEQNLLDNTIEYIFEDPYNRKEFLLVFTRVSLSRLNKHNGKITPYRINETNNYDLAQFGLSSRYIDDCNRVWFAIEDVGLGFLELTHEVFEYYQLGVNQKFETKISPVSFCEDRFGNIWIGTANGGLMQYDAEMNHVSTFLSKPRSFDKLGSYNFIYSVLTDSKDQIWAGHWGLGGIQKLMRKSNKGNEYFVAAKRQFQGLSRIGNIIQDRNGSIWFCSLNGVFIIEDIGSDTINWVEFPITLSENDHKVRSLCEDHEGNMWFATQGDGLLYLPHGSRNPTDLINYKNIPGDSSSLPDNILFAVCADKKGDIWVGSAFGLSRFEMETQSFTNYNPNTGYDISFVFDIECDNNNNLWLSTDRDLIRFNLENIQGRQLKRITKKDGAPFEDIYTYTISKSDRGQIYISAPRGFSSGFYRFYPDSLKDNTHIPPLVFTDFLVDNKSYQLDTTITEINEILLNHDQNFITIKFAALDYKNPEKNEYSYFLEGFDEKWVQAGNRRLAYYTGIPPGHYTFHVKGSNNDGYWNEKGASVMLTILPPPWKTWWAYSIYGIVLILLFYAWRRYDLKRQRLKQELEVEHIQTEKLAELDRMKSQFFTNISHEFRTPLTLILGPVNKIIKYTGDNKIREDLKIVSRNAQRLQRLINQLLNLSQLDAGKLKLQAQKTEIVDFIKKYIQSFESLAIQKNIEYNFHSGSDKMEAYIDRDKMEKILSNLLSNAFKFTNEGGTIEVQVDSWHMTEGGSKQQSGNHNSPGGSGETSPGTSVKITVSDTGPGIGQERLPHIFDRFYHSLDDTYIQEGSGIGLALVKELVELHHGKIEVESKVGTGTKFMLYFPAGRNHLKDDELLAEEIDTSITVDIPDIDDMSHTGMEDRIAKAHPQNEKELPLVLIVDDNADMRSYIRGYLDSRYRVIESMNGKEGLTRSAEEVPDLVVSDVMMPVMDGYEFCKRVKYDERTSHIPVILLTAKAGRDDKLTGLETGADDYMTKPFDGEELLIRIKNLIEQRDRLAKTFQDKTGKGGRENWFELPERSIRSLDERFMEKAAKVVEERLHDPNFNTEAFCEQMALSHSQLYRKIKALTQLTPNEFIRTARLNRAALLIAGKSANIAEIAYDVGFNNPSYFAECFKKKYGVLPSEYAPESLT